MKQYYNFKVFVSMAYVLNDGARVPMFEGTPISAPSYPKLIASPPLDRSPFSMSYNILHRWLEISSNLDFLKDLILDTYLHMEKINDVSKETGADIACIHLNLHQVIKEAIRITTNVHHNTDLLSATIIK